MICFFCGAPKNGSHFQLFTVTESLKQKGIPYRAEGGKIFDHRAYGHCRRLLDDLESRPDEIFILKGHWSTAYERKVLLSYQTIKIFHIWRDLRDALVSTYFYERERFLRDYVDFADYYGRGGRLRTIYLILYERRWKQLQHPRVHHTSFSDLKLQFASEAAKLLSFAEINDVDLQDLEQRISLDRLRSQQEDPEGILFRKGAIGDHSNVIEFPEIYEDIERLQSLATPWLLAIALRSDPRSILSGRFGFPGRRALLGVLRLLQGADRKEPGHSSKRGRSVWWD